MPSPSAAPSGTDQPAQRPRDNGSNNATSAQFLYYTLALIAIIASVCLVSLCYRSVYFSSIFKCNKPRERNVEVIIETNAEFEPEPNYVDADSCTPQNGDVIPSEITNSQKVFLENAHYVQDTESGWSQPEQTPVAVVACGRECSAGNVLARMIGVMVNVPAVSVVENRPNSSVITTIPAIEGLSDRNISNPRGSPHLERNRISTTSDHSNHCDYDYLIQTRRNMEELNETITRISAANESQLQDVQVSDIDSRNLSPNSSHVTSRSVETLPHTTQALNTNGSVTNNPRGSGDSLFYSVHSVNRRTSPIRNNDPCAQQ